MNRAKIANIIERLFKVQKSKCKFNEMVDGESEDCQCSAGYQGDKCTILPNSCGPGVPSCLNNGVCVEGLCVCTKKWTGADCATPCKNSGYKL